MSPQLRTLNGAGLRTQRTTYNIPAPTVKAEVADRLRAIERAAGVPRGANARCCGRCKTPYNCGNPGCPCHLAN